MPSLKLRSAAAPTKDFSDFDVRDDNHHHQPSDTQTLQILLVTDMADRGGAAPAAGGRGGGFGASRGGDRGGDRGRGRGGRRGPRRGGNKSEEKEWQPVTKLGRLVKAGKIKSMEEIYLHSLPIKEYQIVDFFLPKLKDEVMKVRQHLGDPGDALLDF